MKEGEGLINWISGNVRIYIYTKLDDPKKRWLAVVGPQDKYLFYKIEKTYELSEEKLVECLTEVELGMLNIDPSNQHLLEEYLIMLQDINKRPWIIDMINKERRK